MVGEAIAIEVIWDGGQGKEPLTNKYIYIFLSLVNKASSAFSGKENCFF